ncbi:hypothetical protein DBR32_01190 [Taibaiella sp. KBW10]|uniref:M56 family metallopeptidase n=1 Tax=Taibaiella sp. KBW10 TaxID=2153357 RepID=UPI000F5A54A1|nr:M56 family metallopeptidase [Taibaiella sp. KBW10]RQO32253.1 hypothetical protein DBR32_01190 [Taibaiella sp. KBW10]
MKDMLFQLLIANVCLIVVYTVYKGLLAKVTFYKWNRWFLLGAMVIAFTAPFIKLAILPPSPELVIEVTETASPMVYSAPLREVSFWQTYAYPMLLSLIVVGAFVFLLRFVIRLLSLYKVHRNSEVQYWKGIAYRRLNEEVGPFSFAGNIYLNPDLYTDAQITAIITHEYIHVKGGHSFDVLFAELLSILFWYNPLLYKLKDVVNQNLEYIADQEMIEKRMDKKQYQYSLLHVSAQNKYLYLTNSFNIHNLKNRIIMMNQNQTSKSRLFKYALAIPVIIAVGFSFSLTQAQSKTEKLSNAMQYNQVAVTDVNTGTAAIVNRKDASDKKMSAIKGIDYVDGQAYTVEVSAKDASGAAKGRHNLEDQMNAAYAVEAVAVNDQESSGQKASVAIENKKKKNDAAADYEKEAVNIYIDQQNEQVVVANEDGRISARKISYTQVSKAEGKKGIKQKIKIESSDDSTPLIIVNGVEKNKMKLTEIKADDVMTMTVLKDKTATEKYGEKGKNGVILIETK